MQSKRTTELEAGDKIDFGDGSIDTVVSAKVQPNPYVPESTDIWRVTVIRQYLDRDVETFFYCGRDAEHRIV